MFESWVRFDSDVDPKVDSNLDSDFDSDVNPYYTYCIRFAFSRIGRRGSDEGTASARGSGWTGAQAHADEGEIFVWYWCGVVGGGGVVGVVLV